jgi:MFS family permease
MSDSLDLKNIEKKAFRATYQDGLLDINIGGVVLSMSTQEYSFITDAQPLLRIGLLMAGLVVSNLVFWGGKKYLTIPRLGQVKFGPRRQKRSLILASMLAGIVLLQVIFLVGTILLWRNPEWAISLGLHTSNRDLERMMVALIAALFVGPSMTLIAYFTDFLRGYYIAFILSLGAFSLVWFSQPVYFSIAGLIILIPGVVLFVRFLREHPLPPAEASHD